MRNVFRSLCIFFAVCAVLILCTFGTKLYFDRKGADIAAKAKFKAETSRADWAMADQLKAQAERSELRNDRMRVHNAETEIEIARLEGKSTAGPRAELEKYQKLVSLGESIVELDQLSDSLGPSQNVRDSEQQIDAATASLNHYRFGIKHDQWGLATGAAFAFLAVLCCIAWRSAPLIP